MLLMAHHIQIMPIVKIMVLLPNMVSGDTGSINGELKLMNTPDTVTLQDIYPYKIL